MSATYEPFGLAEMQAVLRTDRGWGFADLSDSPFPVKEHVLDWAIPDGPAEGLRIRVYTSVLCATGQTRDNGKDAIRVCVPKRVKSRRVNRTGGWQQRLINLVREVLETIQGIEEKKQKAIAEAKAKQASEPQVDYSAAREMLERAKSNGLKYPKITLSSDGTVVRFQLAGPKSKYAGQVMLSNGEPFDDPTREYYGRIDEEGVWHKGSQADAEVMALVAAFSENPVETVVKLGKKTGHCQFCLKHLSTDESLAAGYGPVCAKNWGLPWGGKENA